MKKSILTLGFVSAMLFGANAQDAATSSSELKAGNITVELNASSPFSGFGADPFSLNNNALRFRYFLNENTAFRLGFSIDRSGFNNTFGNATTTTTSGASASPTTDGTANGDKINFKSSTFQFSIMPGVEKHVMVSNRLSAYYGGYLELTSNSQKAKVEVTAGTTGGSTSAPNFDGSYTYELKGAGVNNPANPSFDFGQNGQVNGITQNGNGFFRFGLMGVAGADYYFTKGLYLGVEVGWGLTSTSFSKVEITVNNSTVAHKDPAASTTTKTVALDKNKSGLQLGSWANASFRFGFRF
jgi:hypothetical protein